MRKAILTIVLIATIAASSTSLVFATNLFDRKDVAATASGDNINITHHSASVNGIVLHYVIAGEGDPVVLLHGFPETSYAWRHVMPILAQNHKVIAPDLRGFGDSSKPAIGYGGKTAAEDIKDIMMPNTGHFVAEEQPEQLAGELEAFFRNADVFAVK
jgi:pimeloyl-ACP methyl ester carboxylesterase